MSVNPNPYSAPHEVADAKTTRPDLSPRAKLWIAAVIGFVGGAAIWALANATAGKEPWDIGIGFYFGAVGLVAFVGGIVAGRHGWTGLIGIWLGQLAYCMFDAQVRPWIPLAMVSTAVIGLLPSILGIGIGIAVRNACARLSRWENS